MKIVKLCVMIVAAGWAASASYGQQATDAVDTQAAEQGQTASDQQDSQLGQSLDTQQSALDEQQTQQLDSPATLDRPQDSQLYRQGELEQPDQLQQGQNLQQQSLEQQRMQSPRQPGFRDEQESEMQARRQPGMVGTGAPGVLGVMIVESAGPGVRIEEVVAGTAAANAGLLPGDVILGINGQGVASAPEVTQMIRAIPAGQVATLTVWRNGQEQEIPATLQAARQRYEANYRDGAGGAMTGDAAARIARLESQLARVIQELQRLRQEVTQLRTARAEQLGGATGFDDQLRQDATQQGLEQPRSTEPRLEQPRATQPGFGQPGATEDPGLEEPATEPRLEEPATEQPLSEPQTELEPALPF